MPDDRIIERFGLKLTAAAFDRLGADLARIDAAEREAWRNAGRVIA